MDKQSGVTPALHARESQEQGQSQMPEDKTRVSLTQRHTPSFGTLTNDLYDEELAKSYHKKALRAACSIGATCVLLVASWAFACLPRAEHLDSPWSPAGDFDLSQIPAWYFFLRYLPPMILGGIALLLFVDASFRARHLTLDFFFADEPPSATLFSSDDGILSKAPRTLRRMLWASAALFAFGLCLAGVAFSFGSLLGGTWECVAHVACRLCISLGAGFAAAGVAYATFTSRAWHIDNYDLLIPLSGADDEYKARIFYDHSHGFSQLVCIALSLLAITKLLVKVREAFAAATPTMTVSGESFITPPDYARAFYLTRGLLGLAPTFLVLAAVLMLIEALVRRRRFVIEWSYMEMPPYPDSLQTVRDRLLRNALLSGVACMALHGGALCLYSILHGSPSNVSGISYMVLIFGGMLVIALAGLMTSYALESLLVSERAYRQAHEHNFPFLLPEDECDEMFAMLEGLSKLEYAQHSLSSTFLFVSQIMLTLLVNDIAVMSWGGIIRALIFVYGS